MEFLREWFTGVVERSTDLFKDPSKVQARKTAERARQFMADNDYAAALADINDAIRLNGNDASFYGTRAYLHRVLHDRDCALADLEKAIQLDPHRLETHFSRASFFEEVGDLDKAIASWTDVIRLTKKDLDLAVKRPDAEFGPHRCNVQAYIQAHQKRAELLIKKGDLQQAICDFDALRVSSQQRGKGYQYLNEAARYYGEQAVLYAKLGNPVKALDCCRAAFEIVETMPPAARSNPGLLNRLAWRVRQEFREFRLISNDSGVDATVGYSYERSQAECHGYQAIVYEGLGDWDKSFSEFQQALGHDAHITFLEHLRQAKKPDKLVLATTEWIQTKFPPPNDAEPAAWDPYCWRGRALHATGDCAGAIRDFTQAIKICAWGCREMQARTWRGDVYLSMGAFDDAIADYSQAIHCQRDFCDERRKAAVAQGLSRDHSYLDQFRESAVPYRRRAVAYEKKGDMAHAAAELDWLEKNESTLDLAEF